MKKSILALSAALLCWGSVQAVAASAAGSVKAEHPTGYTCAKKSTAYVITFKNFESSDLARFEEYFTAFRCYEKHVPLPNETAAVYELHSGTTPASMLRNLRILLDAESIKGSIKVTKDGFEVEKI